MPSQYLAQYSFAKGELDPRMQNARNLELYYKAAQYLRNVYVRPQGGVKRRHGMINQATLYTQDQPIEIIPFIGLTNSYLLYFYWNSGQLSFFVYEISGDGVTLIDSVSTTAWATEPTQIKYAQSGQTLIITGGSSSYSNDGAYPPLLITPNSDPSVLFNFSPVVFKNLPQADFLNNYSTATFTLASVSVALNVVLTCNQPVFTANHVGGTFESLGAINGNSNPLQIGQIQITAYTDSMHVTGNIVAAFDGSLTTGVIGSNCVLNEPAFSNLRGWPNAVAFYESRLVFGGTFSLPQTVWFSQTGDYTNFDTGQGDDDQAFDRTLSGKVPLQVQRIVADKALMVFCDYAEFVSEQTFTQALTPSTTSIRQQSTWGSLDVQPAILDSTIFFAKRGGQAIMASKFDMTQGAWRPVPISLTSEHLINNPISMAVAAGNGVEDADYLIIVNSDKTFVCFQNLSYQDIAAFTLNATGLWVKDVTNMIAPPGLHDAILDVTTVGDNIYCACLRTGGEFSYTIELLSFDVQTDCAYYQTSGFSQTVTSPLLYPLVAQSCNLLIDGIIYPNVLPALSGGNAGTVTLPVLPTQSLQIGLYWQPLIAQLPVTVPGANTQNLPARLIRAWVDYFESQNLLINGISINELEYSNSPGADPTTLNNPTAPRTGTSVVRPMEWTTSPSISVTQTDPLPFLVLGFVYEVTT